MVSNFISAGRTLEEIQVMQDLLENVYEGPRLRAAEQRRVVRKIKG